MQQLKVPEKTQPRSQGLSFSKHKETLGTRLVSKWLLSMTVRLHCSCTIKWAIKATGNWSLVHMERLSYDLEKVFAICFTDQCLTRLKQSFSLFPPRKLIIWAVNSSIAQSHYCISNDVKAKLSRKCHGEFAAAFTKPMKIRGLLFLFDKPIKCFAFLFRFCVYVFQGHMKVALIWTFHIHTIAFIYMASSVGKAEW